MENIETIKSKYIQGKASEDELIRLLKWLDENPGEKEELCRNKDIWDAYGMVVNSADYSEVRELKRFHKRIEKPKDFRQIRLPSYLKIAAAFVVAFILSWIVQSQLTMSPAIDTKQAKIQTIFVPKGQVNQVFLADGSRIWINSESTIEAPSVFTGNERVVKLSGEAFFEVAKDANHPFKVMVEGQTIEVLGTSFNVRAYKNSAKIQTTLKTGAIKLTTSDGTTLLSPGEQTELDKSSGKLVLKEVNTSTFEAWKDGRYEFDDENLIEVFHMVERWYDVELSYNEADFRDMKFKGVLKRNKPVQHFLTLLGTTIPIRYEINLDKITIERISK